MAGPLQPLDIRCDAPPFPVVGACQKVGFRSPLDVRWCRLSHFLAERSGRPNTRRGAQGFATKPAREKTCTCGEPLPRLEKYAITFVLEKVADYLLGQCRRCGTMSWEES
jgi:hypothetical protein